MPLRDFICAACGEKFEELVFRDEEEVCCPKCGKTDVKRQLSRFAFKSGSGKMKTSVGGSCSSCRPGPSGCSSCGT